MEYRPPSLHHDNNICPYCFTSLDIRLCKNGPNKKKNYLLCSKDDLHKKGKPYWHFWTLEQSKMYQNGQLQPPPNRASSEFPASLSDTLPSTSRSILASPELASASYNFPSSLSPALPSTSRSVLATQDLAHSQKTTCCQRGCSSTRVAIACKSQLCKEHCIIQNKGSCPVKKHHPTSMSERQRRKANISRPFPARSPSLDPHWTPNFQAMLQDVAAGAAFAWEKAPALQRMQMEQPAQALDRALHSSGFDLPSPLERDSPDVDEREAMELRHAIALSLASTPTPSPESPSSSSAVFPSSSSTAPQRRVQAPSVVPRTTFPAKPRHTTHLNPSWMAQAKGTRPANDTFNLPQRSERRAAVDLATIQRFTLVYWDCDGKDPLILGVTECPSWPNFRLSEAPKTLALMGTDFLAVQYYEVPFRIWKRVDLNYPHILTPNTYLLMRRIGVSGRDQQRLVDQFVNSPGPQHIRYHLPAERDAVRVKLKARRKDPIPDDDSDVEVVEETAAKKGGTDAGAKKGGAVNDDDDADVVVLERPLLRITTTGTVKHPVRLDQHPSPSSSSSSRRSTSSFSRCATPSTAPTTPLLSSAPPPSLPDASNKWPKGMFTLDMADGFMQMERPELQHLPVADRFRKVFKTDRPYVARTYADARLRWSRGSEALRTEAYDAGRTSEGLWSAYAAQVPLKSNGR
ncbi:hypothetical protein C8R47DRAFT_1327225 [Mycena vitilis]|nr:hypothetical protein C8R47DRAFT_1327225 [Mycena vitilis]